MRSLTYALLLLILWSASVVHAQGVAVVQSAAPTSGGGTQDFTSTGFGTPVCAIFFIGYGTANGTVVNDAFLGFGITDFTNSRYVASVQEDTGSTTDTLTRAGTDPLISMLNTDQSVDGTASVSTITDGARLTWADAPPSAYLVTAILFNSSMFSNCTVGTLTPNATQDATASVSGLGWAPDLVIGLYQASTGRAKDSFGVALNDGGIVQRSIGQWSQTGVGTSTLSSALMTTRIAVDAQASSLASLELTSFDAGGFTLTTRDAATPLDFYHLTAKLATGASAKLTTCDSPTSTGSHSCTGAGFTPTATIMMHTALTTVDTRTITDESEVYGLSAMTASAAYSSAVADDDNVVTANTESMTDSKPVRLRKDAADFMTATFSGFQSDGADFSYSTTDGSARKRAMLFLKGVSSASSFGPLRRRF